MKLIEDIKLSTLDENVSINNILIKFLILSEKFDRNIL